MLDLGLKPGMIAGAVVSIFAQRLARRLCGECKVEYAPDAEECELLQLEEGSDVKIFRASDEGCATCGGQGYKGRVAVVEILMFDEALNDVVSSGGSKADLKRVARENGFKGKELKEFENSARLCQLEVEYAIKFQDKLIESEHGGVFPEKPPSFPFIIEEIDID